MGKSALLLGATGLTGGMLLYYLLESDAYETVSVIGRNSTGKKHPKLIEHIFDLSEMAKHADVMTADSVFCCLGTTIKKAGSKGAFRKIDYDYPIEAGILAHRNGAKQFNLVSSIGADKDSRFFYLKIKGQVEEAVSEIGFESTRIFRPAGLLGKRGEFRIAEKLGNVVMKALAPVMIGPLRKSRPIQADHVAFVMAHLPSTGIDGTRIYESNEIQQLYNSMT